MSEYFESYFIRDELQSEDTEEESGKFGEVEVSKLIDVLVFDDAVDGQELQGDQNGRDKDARFDEVFFMEIRNYFKSKRKY